MKKAFSLVELIVVIGIIGVLAGVLIASFGGSSESARAAQCLANMRNLANACQTYGATNGEKIYPRVLSSEEKVTELQDNGVMKIFYKEMPGWISWFSKGNYPGGKAQSAQSNPSIGFKTSDKEESLHALTNSCIWTIVGRNRETFVCPAHVKQCGKAEKPTWSYLMNKTQFGWKPFGELERADRVLLFSEIPFKPWHSSWLPSGKSSGTDDDPALQYEKNETIGANHVNGRNLFAHVAFADGHTEKLRIPYTGNIKSPQIDESQLKDLTQWLCEGTDIGFDGKKYQKLDN